MYSSATDLSIPFVLLPMCPTTTCYFCATKQRYLLHFGTLPEQMCFDMEQISDRQTHVTSQLKAQLIFFYCHKMITNLPKLRHLKINTPLSGANYKVVLFIGMHTALSLTIQT
jgi:hypothetical protein